MWSVSELEMASILYALETNSQYFIGKRFKIYTDHISNTWVQNLKFSQGRLYRWSLRIQNYLFDIYHLPGSKMPADYLSRIVERRDNDSRDLTDDSHLVFAVASAVDNDSTPKVVRPGRRRTTIITIPTRPHGPHDSWSTSRPCENPPQPSCDDADNTRTPNYICTDNPHALVHTSSLPLSCQACPHTGGFGHKTVGNSHETATSVLTIDQAEQLLPSSVDCQ